MLIRFILLGDARRSSTRPQRKAYVRSGTCSLPHFYVYSCLYLQPHGNIIPLKGDVTSSSSLASLVEHITKDVGYVNLVIANSGIGGADRPSMPPESSISALRTHLFSVSNEAFTNTFAVNTTAVFYTTVAFLELLDAGNKRGNVSQKSQVIATSSIGGFNRRPMAGFAYGASKAAVTHLMKSLASYLVPFDIRCNVLAPGCKCNL